MPRKSESLFMGSTDKPAHQSIHEITQLLVQFGADRIINTYSQNKITGMCFSVVLPNKVSYTYTIPARTEHIYTKLRGSRKRSTTKESDATDLKQAEQIAWRQLLRWVEAQLALVQVGLSTVDEVFMAYSIDQNGRTMYQLFKASEQKQLTGSTYATKS